MRVICDDDIAYNRQLGNSNEANLCKCPTWPGPARNYLCAERNYCVEQPCLNRKHLHHLHPEEDHGEVTNVADVLTQDQTYTLTVSDTYGIIGITQT